MSFDDMIEKYVRSIVADAIANTDWIAEKLDSLNHRLQLLEEGSRVVTPVNLEFRVARLEDKDFITRSQAKDIAYETLRDADHDELLGSFVYGKIEEKLGDDEFRDRLARFFYDALEHAEFTMKVQ